MSENELDAVESMRQRRRIDRVARTLREEVPVRDAWRAGVLRDLATLAPPRAEARALAPGKRHRWEVRPLMAIAAGLLCAVAGAAGTALVVARTPHTAASTVGSRANVSATSMPIAPTSTIRFVFVAPYASRVSLVGDFNRWNPHVMPMRRSSDGRTWTLDVPLAAGRHLYSFFIDGDLAPDPAAPRAGDDDFGVPSSVILVAGGRT